MAQRRLGVDAPESSPSTNSSDQKSKRFGLDKPAESTGNLRFFPAAPNRRLGLAQVGEANAEIVHQAVTRASVSGPEALMSKADRLLDDGEAERAIEIYRKLLTSQPQMIGAQVGLGYALIDLGKYEDAARELRQAVAVAPNNAEAQLDLGVALYRGGHIEEAIAQYQNIIANQKDHRAAAHFNLAGAYAHQGDFPQAIEQYRAAIDLRANYPEAYNNLGLIYEATERLDDAGAQFRQAIEQRHGRYPLAHYNLARFYSIQRKYQEAIDEFQLAIKQQADFPEACLDLGNIYLVRTITMNTTELDAAIAAYNQAIKLRNRYPLAHENLAIALTRSGKKEEAIEQYRIAFDQYEGQCPETIKNLISTISGKKSFLIGNELSRSENAANLKHDKDINKLDERIVAALSKFDELDDEYKNSPSVHYCIARSYAAIGQWNSAVDEFANAVELSKNTDNQSNQAIGAIIDLVRYY